MNFVRQSFGPLFGDWKYVLLLYTSGSLVLGGFGHFLESRGVPDTVAISVLVLLVLPFHFLLYGVRESYGQFVEYRVELETRLLSSYGADAPDFLRKQVRRRSLYVVRLSASFALLGVVAKLWHDIGGFDPKDIESELRALESFRSVLSFLGFFIILAVIILFFVFQVARFSLVEMLRDVAEFRQAFPSGRATSEGSQEIDAPQKTKEKR